MGSLRLILAITVIIAHTKAIFGFTFTGGLVAVEMFFMISGFYMAMILNKTYIGEGSYTLFLSNRFLRLYPMFWAILLLTILVSIIAFNFTGKGFWLSEYIQYFDVISIKTLIWQIFVNIALFGQDVCMFLGFNSETGGMYFTPDFHTTSHPMFHKFLIVPQAWSLGTEVMFYLIAPFLVRRSNLFIISIIVFSLAIRIFTYSLGYTNDPWTYRFFPSELSLFLLGTISYRLYDVYKIQSAMILKYNLTNIVLVLLFSIIICYQFIPFTGYERHIFRWLFYGYFCLSIPFLFEISKSSKIDSRIGELSYPVYISHIFVIGCITPLLSLMGWQNYQNVFAVIITILFSYILVRLIADPIEKTRRSRVKNAKTS